eukprot:CAMPEP_0168792318 /NCGR_PEP_ID=MMETSP0725-20121227/14458_1 /TAXON_ID=265536 /ORGANISM="Amphiprora sp., Strain CCMP467" /LENGTH=33 /DNA_ID= /DNA_START= /DNA_END= /DNA_ORIENTATION=
MAENAKPGPCNKTSEVVVRLRNAGSDSKTPSKS